MKRTTKILLMNLLALVAAGSMSGSAGAAYVHNWGNGTYPSPNCSFYNAYTSCPDQAGQIYNAWTGVRGQLAGSNSGRFTQNCVMAITQAGNIKGGSVCRASTDVTIFPAASPSSQAYFYFGDTGNFQNWAGRATTS